MGTENLILREKDFWRVLCWTQKLISHTQKKKSRAPNCLGLLSSSTPANLLNVYKSESLKSGNSREVGGLTGSFNSQVSDANMTSKHFALIRKAPPKSPCVCKLKRHFFPPVHMISPPCRQNRTSIPCFVPACPCGGLSVIWESERVSSKCSTLEHTERNRAKSKLCNWILRGWLGIADLAVIKTTLLALVLHHGYSKTADWPQM